MTRIDDKRASLIKEGKHMNKELARLIAKEVMTELQESDQETWRICHTYLRNLKANK
tara:strand:- start:17745 stop:17915 length:171 start_codon:yes stop_codon:yes gene_type:complete